MRSEAVKVTSPFWNNPFRRVNPFETILDVCPSIFQEVALIAHRHGDCCRSLSIEIGSVTLNFWAIPNSDFVHLEK